MNHSMPGLPVHHQLLEFTQTHVHWVSDAIQPSHPLSSPSPPALNLSQHQGLFKWVSSLHQVAKVLEFQLQHQSFQLSESGVLKRKSARQARCDPFRGIYCIGWGPGVTCCEENQRRNSQKHPQCDPSQVPPPTKTRKKAEKASEASPSDLPVHTSGFSEGIIESLVAGARVRWHSQISWPSPLFPDGLSPTLLGCSLPSRGPGWACTHCGKRHWADR